MACKLDTTPKPCRSLAGLQVIGWFTLNSGHFLEPTRGSLATPTHSNLPAAPDTTSKDWPCNETPKIVHFRLPFAGLVLVALPVSTSTGYYHHTLGQSTSTHVAPLPWIGAWNTSPQKSNLDGIPPPAEAATTCLVALKGFTNPCSQHTAHSLKSCSVALAPTTPWQSQDRTWVHTVCWPWYMANTKPLRVYG